MLASRRQKLFQAKLKSLGDQVRGENLVSKGRS